MKTIKNGLLMSLVMLLSFAGSAAAAPAANGPNLLQNPGFESPYVKQCCGPDGLPIGEVQVAHGWLGWWLQPGDAQHPSSGGTPSWHRPEWREANCGSPCANRIHSGNNAQKYFTFDSVHDAGMYQQVSGIAPGTLLQFSIYMQGWSTNQNYGPSDFVQHMGMRVGIDPFGGTDAFSPNVIWTAVNDTFDAWGLYTIQATAQAGTVTVFTRSSPLYGSQHNDIYLDDASLVAVGADGGGANNPPPVNFVPPPVPTPIPGFTYVVLPGDNYYRIAVRFGVSLSALLAANPSAHPNILFVGTVLTVPGVSGQTNNPPPATTVSSSQPAGAVTYVVQRGDNLFRLSLRFGVSVARIKELNNLVGDIIWIGQVLIIAP